MTDLPALSIFLVAALTLGAVHTLLPDHWLPIVAVSRSRGWSWRHTLRITLVCATVHVGATAALALVATFLGHSLAVAFGHRLEDFAGLLLVAFGLTYAAWGLHRALSRRLATGEALEHFGSGGLIAFFAADPCLPLIPLVVSAAPHGTAASLTLILPYGAATLATMLALVLPAHASLSGSRSPRQPWRWAETAAGLIVCGVGLAMAWLG